MVPVGAAVGSGAARPLGGLAAEKGLAVPIEKIGRPGFGKLGAAGVGRLRWQPQQALGGRVEVGKREIDQLAGRLVHGFVENGPGGGKLKKKLEGRSSGRRNSHRGRE